MIYTSQSHTWTVSQTFCADQHNQPPTAAFAILLYAVVVLIRRITTNLARARCWVIQAVNRRTGTRPNCHIWYSSLRYRSLSRRFECRVLLHSLLIVSRLWAYDDCLAMNVNQSQSPTPFPDDFLPPEGEYESREALFEAINAWAATRGYAFITGRSTKEKTGRRTITYMCDRRRNHPIVSRNANVRRQLEQQAASSLYWRRKIMIEVPGLCGTVLTADSHYITMNLAKTPPPT